MTTTQKQLEHLKKSVALSAPEKVAGRARLAAYLQEHPLPKRVVSPYTVFFTFSRYALALLLILGATGSGVAFASEKARPGDALYSVRVRVAEPVRVALTKDTKARAALEVAIVDQRLRDLAQVTVAKEDDAEVTSLVVSSLETRLARVRKDIDTLKDTDERDYAALATASDLEATLAAHTEVLERLSSLDEETAEAIEEVALSIASSTEAIRDITEALEEELGLEDSSEDEVNEALEDEEEEASKSVDEIVRPQVDRTHLDEDDAEEVDAAVKQIQTVVEAAGKKKQEGDSKEALRLYSEVNEQTKRLKTLIDADATLGVDLFGTQEAAE